MRDFFVAEVEGVWVHNDEVREVRARSPESSSRVRVPRSRNDVKGAMTLYLSLRLNAFAVLGGVGQAADAEGFSFCCAGFRCLFIVALNQTVVAI